MSEVDKQAFAAAILDPAYGITQRLEALQKTLDPLWREAEEFLNSLESKSANSTTRLNTLSHRQAREVIEEQAAAITDMLHAAKQVALELCTTKVTCANNGKHYVYHPTSKKRKKLNKQLHIVQNIRSHLNYPVISSATSIEEILQKNDRNQSLCQAISNLNAFAPDHLKEDTLQNQVKGVETHIREELARLDKTHSKECHQRARRSQQSKVSKHPKQAHKKYSLVLAKTGLDCKL